MQIRVCSGAKSCLQSSSLPGKGEGDTVTNGHLCPAFKQKGGKAETWLPSAQNNQYAKVAYLGVACSGLFRGKQEY